MAATVITQGLVLVGGFDATTFAGQAATSPAEAGLVTTTNLGSGGFETNLPSIKSFGLSLSGNADVATTGITTNITPANIGTQYAYGYALPGSAAADPAVFGRGLLMSYTPIEGAIGDKASFAMTFRSDLVGVTNGQLASTLAARTTTANGTILTMTGPTASQKLYAGLHITAASGTTPTLDVTIESAALVGFGSPTTRITFSQKNAAGWDFSSVAGAVTNGFWRAVFTIGGTSPSFTVAVFLGVA